MCACVRAHVCGWAYTSHILTAPSANVTLLEVIPDCPNDLIVTWMIDDPSGINGPPDTVQLIITLNNAITRNFSYHASGEGVSLLFCF